MNRKLKTALLIAAFAAVIAAAYFAYGALSARYRPNTPLSAETSGSSSSVEAPDFTVYDTDGTAVRLSDFRGTPVVLNFWASWCYYCTREMPAFDRVYQEEKDSVRFLFVNWTDGSRETQEKGEAYLKEKGYGFPAYYDLNQEAVSAYELTGIPATVFIRSDGTVAGGQSGAIDEETLKQGIERIRDNNS
ncbi:MAG: TlpA family protein disulfide reductase [Oscillospiraceae bacterium]|jgi:thiol-disulfide isomerase/thioredoxin|nr:TlpA family protein disulfide reductase [Oscillospiraceae bacterium]